MKITIAALGLLLGTAFGLPEEQGPIRPCEVSKGELRVARARQVLACRDAQHTPTCASATEFCSATKFNCDLICKQTEHDEECKQTCVKY